MEKHSGISLSSRSHSPFCKYWNKLSILQTSIENREISSHDKEDINDDRLKMSQLTIFPYLISNLNLILTIVNIPIIFSSTLAFLSAAIFFEKNLSDGIYYLSIFSLGQLRY